MQIELKANGIIFNGQVFPIGHVIDTGDAKARDLIKSGAAIPYDPYQMIETASVEPQVETTKPKIVRKRRTKKKVVNE